jgi:hypothetical protein
VVIDGRRRKITKNEVLVAQMVDKSARRRSACDQDVDRHDKERRREGRRRATAVPTRRLAEADKEVVQLFVARLRRQILHEIEGAKVTEPSA